MQVIGSYTTTKQATGLLKYCVPCFLDYVYKNIQYAYSQSLAGCGQTTFVTLTGKLMSNDYDSVNDELMINSLDKLKEYTIIPLSVSAVTNHSLPFYNTLRQKHVILISQLVMKGEATWAVLYDNRYFHGLVDIYLHPLEFLTRPILTAYIIYNKKWNKPKGRKNEKNKKIYIQKYYSNRY